MVVNFIGGAMQIIIDIYCLIENYITITVIFTIIIIILIVQFLSDVVLTLHYFYMTRQAWIRSHLKKKKNCSTTEKPNVWMAPLAFQMKI